MRKITLILGAIILSSSLLFAQSKKEIEKAVKLKSVSVSKGISSKGVTENTDTLSNIYVQPTLYSFTNGWGYWTGHNTNSWTKFSEKFTPSEPGELNGFAYAVAKAHNAGSGIVTFKVWNDIDGLPGEELHSQQVNISDMTENQYNDLIFTEPIFFSSTFHVGYELTYNTPVDTFAVFQTNNGVENTFNYYDGTQWNNMPNATGGAVPKANLAILAYVNYDAEITVPVAQINTTEWNIITNITETETSETFTLTNNGAGTLTISEISDLSSSSFTTTLNSSEVSLEADETYDFTFNYSSDEVESISENFVITTNAGDVTITLNGEARTPITENMDGGFESNVYDFDLDFHGWTQHDEDGLPTYPFQSLSFTNMGYTGSFIAFNPASTTPAISDLSAHTGNRFGACFSAMVTNDGDQNNDWLITPATEITESIKSFRFYARSISENYIDRFNVLVSTTDTEITNFTKVSTGEYTESTEEWTQYTYDLSEYNGETVYVAIQCVSVDAFYFLVDDIEFSSIIVDIEDNSVSNISIYPNPAQDFINIENVENANISVMNMVGQEVIREHANNNNAMINTSELSEGTYIIRIETGNEVKTQKVNIVR